MVAHAQVIPVRVDAMRVGPNTKIAEPSAAFQRLPYNDGRRDVNAGVPFLAEQVTTEPFEDATAWLAPGVHLHWALPRVLTRGRHRPDNDPGTAWSRINGIDFPLVPNRWLVRTPADEWWIVESDHVHPELEQESRPGVSFLLNARQREQLGTNAPALFVGRQMRLADWRPSDKDSGRRLPGLTAVGWGDPTFHGFYPNCWSILGFHDPKPGPGGRASGYDVYGYYSDTASDPLAWFAADNADLTPGELLAAIDAEFGLRSQNLEDWPWEVPSRMLLVGRVAQPESEPTEPDSSGIATVGLSGIECLASHLARAVGPAVSEARALTPTELEESFEAMVLAPRLDFERPDAYAKLQEARHDHGFVGTPGGSRWTIRTKGPGLTADAAHAPPAVHGSAADEAAGHLHELNRAQQELDRLARRQNSLSEQLYADWCTYLISKYPPRGEVGDLPDPDETRRHIELNRLAQLEVNIVEWRRQLARVTALTVEVITALTVQDLEALRITTDDVGDWDGLDATLRSLGVDDARLDQVDPTDDDARREQLLAMANRLIIDDPIPPTLLATAAPAMQIEENLTAWLRQPVPGPADLLTKSAPVRHQIFGRDDDITNEHQQRWLDHLATSVATWHRSVRARTVIELAATGSVKSVTKSRHHLEVLPGPRFWSPRDPVVLLNGPVAFRSNRYPRDNPDNRPYSSSLPIGPDPAGSIPAAVGANGPTPTDYADEIHTLITQLPGGNLIPRGPGPLDWHPVHVDWSVSVTDQTTPPADLGEIDTDHPDDRPYEPTFVTDRYRIPPGEPDLIPLAAARDGSVVGDTRTHVFSGRSTLSGHVSTELANAITRLAPPDPENPTTFDRLSEWAAEELVNSEGFLQTFSLTGFNTARLGHRSILPLPVADPLAFTESQGFTERVARAIGRHTTMAPNPLGPFLPLWGGRFALSRVRVIDSFGRVADVALHADGDEKNVFASTALQGRRVERPSEETADDRAFDIEVAEEAVAEDTTDPPGPDEDEKSVIAPADRLVLPARVVPPTRLNIRWLAADHRNIGAGEAHDHPSTGPICGWVVPNVLEGRLMIHHASGKALGSIDQAGSWRPPPGRDTFTPPDDIDNPGLRQVVLQLLHESSAEQADVLVALMESLETIAPDSHAQHRALSLLMGRPIAVVRATVRLELLGRPPVSQRRRSYRELLAGGVADSAGLHQVRFPIRFGEPGQLDDGVVGFWVERGRDVQGNGTRFDGPLFTPQLNDDGGGSRRSSSATESSGGHLELMLDDEATALTVLMDPRGRLHATTGILPTKVLDIPHEQYADALDSIGVTFLTAPLLCDPGTVQVALPAEPGYEWSWLQRSPDGWKVEAGAGIDPPSTQATLSGQQRLREGWLRLSPERER